MREQHAHVLYAVLAINAAMFLVEGIAGSLSDSTSLLADSLDMLGDALVYAFSLFVLFANVGVLIAAGLGFLLSSRWPDIIVGARLRRCS